MVETKDGPTMVLVEKGEYEELLRLEEWMFALESAGIDNWDGYDVAQDILEENRK